MIEKTTYQSLCHTLEIAPVSIIAGVDAYCDERALSQKSKEDIFASALKVLLQQVEEGACQASENNDFIAQYINKIDMLINTQLNSILHNPEFQALEVLWRQVEYLMQQSDEHSNIKVDLLDVTKEELREDFDTCGHYSHSALFEHVYRQEYDTTWWCSLCGYYIGL